MASIKCKSCGRVYNYRSSELCPKCGAYNRPPHQMRVGFDENGSVELQSDREFRENVAEADTVEETVRKVGETLISSETLDALGRELNKWGSRVEKWWTENSEKSATHAKVAKDSPLRDRKKSKSGGGRIVAIVVAISVFASLIGSITESCGSNRVAVFPAPEPDVSIATEEVAPTEVYWSEEHRKAILDSYAVSEEVGLSEVFELYGSKYWVGDWQLTGGGSGDNVMIIAVNGNEFPADRLHDCFLLWVDWNGTEWTYAPGKFQNGALIFRSLHTTAMPEGTLCWLMFNDYDDNGNWRSTTAVSLVEHNVYFGDGSQDFASTEAVTVWSEEDCKNLLSFHDVTEEYSMGSGFIWLDSRVGIYGWGKDDSTMDVSIEGEMLSGEELLDMCYLLWYDLADGEEHMYHPDSYENGALVFKNIRSEILDTTYIWLIMQEGYILNTESNTMENIGTIAVRLN
ncbi:MAG: hypothetical protein IKV99_02550 [Oscillospiraceae bacterium]|nr:hypothetical protein [Oscillospiraceae bacterium]